MATPTLPDLQACLSLSPGCLRDELVDLSYQQRGLALLRREDGSIHIQWRSLAVTGEPVSGPLLRLDEQRREVRLHGLRPWRLHALRPVLSLIRRAGWRLRPIWLMLWARQWQTRRKEG